MKKPNLNNNKESEATEQRALGNERGARAGKDGKKEVLEKEGGKRIEEFEFQHERLESTGYGSTCRADSSRISAHLPSVHLSFVLESIMLQQPVPCRSSLPFGQ